MEENPRFVTKLSRTLTEMGNWQISFAFLFYLLVRRLPLKRAVFHHMFP